MSNVAMAHAPGLIDIISTRHWVSVSSSALALESQLSDAQCRNTDRITPAQLQVRQEAGRAMVELTHPDKTGRVMEIDYGDETYSGTFGQDGRARIGFVLTEANAAFTIRVADEPPVMCEVEVPDFDKIFRVTLRWREPVRLDLNVIEPGGTMGAIGHVSAMRPNAGLTHGMGQMDIVGTTPAEGATAELSYVLPVGTALPKNAEFGYRVEYVSRGPLPAAPFCDDHALAVAQMDLIILDRGKLTTRKLRTNRANCGEIITETRRFMSVR